MSKNLQRTCLVIGNGPSAAFLTKKHLDQVHTIGVNHCYKLFEKWGSPCNQIVITDSNRLREIGNAYRKFEGDVFVGDERKAIPSRRMVRRLLCRDAILLRQRTKANFPTSWLTDRLTFHRFLYSSVFDKWSMSFDFNEGLNFGRSVVISAIQIAVLQGYTKIVLVGVDTSYDVDRDYAGDIGDSVQYVNPTFISNPRLHMEPFLVMLQVYFDSMGVELVDASNGALKFIPTEPIDTALGFE